MVESSKQAAQNQSYWPRLSLSRKMVGALIGASLLAAGAVGVNAVLVVSEVQRESSAQALVASVQARSDALRRLVEQVETDLAVLAGSSDTARHLRDFDRSFRSVADQSGADSIRNAYIDGSPHPVGQRHLLDEAAGATQYDVNHGKRHATYRELLLGRGYYDIFMISEAGDIVYTVYKELDFGTNLETGDYRETGLADAFRAARKLDDAGAVAFADFEPYAPSFGAPAAFVAAPVIDAIGGRAGVIAIQLPIDRFAAAIAAHGDDETYLIGADGVLRSDLRHTEAVDVLTRSADAAIFGAAVSADAPVVVESAGILGAPAKSALAEVDVFGQTWRIVAERPMSAIETPIADLQTRMLGITGAIILAVAFVAFFAGRSLARPILKMRAAVDRLAKGDAVAIPGAERGDEIGDLARSMTAIHAASLAATRVRNALDRSSAPVLVANAEFEIVYANAAMVAALGKIDSFFAARGVSAAELVGKSLDLFHVNAAARRRDLEALTAPHKEEAQIEDRLFDQTVAPVFDAEGARIGYVLEWQDITSQRKAENEIAATIQAVAAGDFSRRPQVTTSNRFIADAVGGLTQVCEIVDGFVEDVETTLGAMAEGDLTCKMDESGKGRYLSVAKSANAAVTRLSALIGDIKASEAAMRGSIIDVERGAVDLASRAENQASSLEETAATMEEMSATINGNADAAVRAAALADETRGKAAESDAVVAQAVEAMAAIEESSSKITDIISVIDGIAFQTNLLALNAAVEAARAGEAGKGFAVVAAEVRTLAQRSSEAARDIKALISTSSVKVSDGVRLVRATGEALEGIRAAIAQVTSGITDISSASREQATGVGEITSAVTHMDEMTQQNASLADQSAASARTLAAEAERLSGLVAFFKVAAAETARDAAWTKAEREAKPGRPAPAVAAKAPAARASAPKAAAPKAAAPKAAAPKAAAPKAAAPKAAAPKAAAGQDWSEF